MRTFHSVLLVAVLGALVRGSPAQAGLCVPQTEFTCSGLQAHLNTLGQAIDVLTQQQEGLVWGTGASLNATMTIMFQLAGNPNQDEFGIVGINSQGHLAGLCAVFPSDDFNTGYFAVASFRAGNTLRVNLFDNEAKVVKTTSYTGVDPQRFAYYIKNAQGTFFSHLGYNVDGKVHALVFAGTNSEIGNWWMAWEDSMNPTPAADFGDGLVFLGALSPTPVSHATWGEVKARFR